MSHMLTIDSTSGYAQDATVPVQPYAELPMYNRTDSPMQYNTVSDEQNGTTQAVPGMYINMGDPQAMANVNGYSDGTYMTGYGQSVHM